MAKSAKMPGIADRWYEFRKGVSRNAPQVDIELRESFLYSATPNVF